MPLEQLDKTTWRSLQGAARCVLSYRVYAFDTSVRTAFLDARRGFFNGTSLCLRVEGREAEPHRLAHRPRCRAGWQVATAMPPARRGRARLPGGRLRRTGRPPGRAGHASGAALHGRAACRTSSWWPARWPGFDGARLLADTRRICEAQIASGTAAASRPPFERYVFLLNAVDDGYGGLEHRASTALICARGATCRAWAMARPATATSRCSA